MTDPDGHSECLADRLAAVQLVVVGSMMIDQITYCSRFPADGETLVATSYAQGFGGKGANQAVMAARLGATVAFVGCLGDDALGDAVVANFATAGVDATDVARAPGLPSGVAPIWVDSDGTNRILIAPGANDALSVDHVSRALVRRTRNAHVVLAQLETPQSATAAAFGWGRGVGAITVLNPAPAAPVLPAILEQVGWIVANESEFAIVSGYSSDLENVALAAQRWRCGVVVTLGAAGALFATPGQETAAVESPAVSAVDTTGAGDAFVGAFTVGLAAGLTPLDAVRLGCASGSLSVRQRGTQTSYPTRDDVLASISSNTRSHRESESP